MIIMMGRRRMRMRVMGDGDQGENEPGTRALPERMISSRVDAIQEEWSLKYSRCLEDSFRDKNENQTKFKKHVVKRCGFALLQGYWKGS